MPGTGMPSIIKKKTQKTWENCCKNRFKQKVELFLPIQLSFAGVSTEKNLLYRVRAGIGVGAKTFGVHYWAYQMTPRLIILEPHGGRGGGRRMAFAEFHTKTLSLP